MSDRGGCELVLVMPGMFGSPCCPSEQAPTDGISLPALETFLARADRTANELTGLEARLFGLFGVPVEEGVDLPVAAVTRALDLGVIDSGWWVRADPINLVPDRDRLILGDSQTLDLSQEEANGLVAEIMEAYGTDGWSLKAPHPGRWYLKPPKAPQLTTTPLAMIVGRDIHPYLPQGADGKAWHTLLNEMQILLHTAGVNSKREATGKPPINSLWFWGGGRLPKMQPADWLSVWSTESVSRALARLCEIPSAPVPANFLDWKHQARRGRHLVVHDAPRASVAYGDWPAWATAVQDLETNWIAPALAALRQGSIDRISLMDELGSVYVLTPQSARRWWRWRRSLAHYRA
ncbi:MAG: hypothetical protein JSW09_10035 [Pseudomonadota bacterium]|nr:MAG: hypothetical protein JSW09_10035 [Pseudomonadota bacterium]